MQARRSQRDAEVPGPVGRTGLSPPVPEHDNARSGLGNQLSILGFALGGISESRAAFVNETEPNDIHATVEGQQGAIPWEQIGTEAQKVYEGDGISLWAQDAGAGLRVKFQELKGQ